MRSLLVHLDASAACAVRLHVARRLAEQLGASVTALFSVVPGSDSLPSSFFSAAAGSEAIQAFDIDGRQHARAAIEKAVSLGGPPVMWAETAAEPPLRALFRHALFADLLVLGKRDRAGPHAEQLPPGFAESALINSGKPALVVPDGARPGELGRTVVIAWKPTRACARAVTAALPILRLARGVHVVMWQDKQNSAPVAHHLGKLATFLEQHDIAAQTHALGTEPARIGDAILAETSRHGGDLLVMGCYGRSRARELLLGGASRSVLRAMPLPVLMAH
jgi:nucleotide-binding universal stress UspA family protein